jgi:integrase
VGKRLERALAAHRATEHLADLRGLYGIVRSLKRQEKLSGGRVDLVEFFGRVRPFQAGEAMCSINITKHTPFPRHLYTSMYGCDILPLTYLNSTKKGKNKRLYVSPHDLRHRYGYRLADSVPLHRLAQLMGHDHDLHLGDEA